MSTFVAVGRVAPTQAHDEQIYVDLSNPRLEVDEVRELIDRLEEQLTLLDGGRVVPETPATDEIDVNGHPADSMMGSSDPHISEDEGEERDGGQDGGDEGGSADEVVPTSAEARSHDLDGIVAVDQVGEAMVENLREEGFDTIGDVFDTSIAEVARTGGIGNGTASRIHDYCADVINGEPDTDVDSDADAGDGVADEPAAGSENGADESVKSGVEPLSAGEIESVLAEYDVDHEVDVSDVIQAVDEYSACFRVGRMLGIDRPTVEVLIGQLGLKPALESDGRLAARRVQATEAGETA